MMEILDIPRLVIHDSRRVDRMEILNNELSNFFSDTNTKIVEAIMRNNHSGILESHQKCIKMAIDNSWDNVLIMEDDVRFLPGSRSCAEFSFKHLPKKWDILLGGCYYIERKNNSQNWVETGPFSGAHFYVANRSSYDKILSLKYDNWAQYDKQLGLLLSCWVSWPMFAIQHNGHSDNLGTQMNYDNLLTKHKFKLCGPVK